IGLYSIVGLNAPEKFQDKRVLRIQQVNDTPRFSLFSPDNPEVLVVRYWDSGAGRLDLNVRRTADNAWYTIDRSLKGNTSTWYTAVFPVPRIAGQSVLEFGLHATGSDFIVDDIEVKPLLEPWFALYGSPGNETFPAETRPSAVFVYLPFLTIGQRLTVSATAGGRNLSVEVFRNLIRPELTTGWWLQYSSRARIPSLPTQGTPGPRLDYIVPAGGTYTVVIVLSLVSKAELRPKAYLILIAAAYAVILNFLPVVVFQPFYRIDSLSYTHYSAVLLLQGRNPYAESMIPSLTAFGVPPDAWS